jgi:hypothetical protein
MICFSKPVLIGALMDERGCRRDIRSNGWIDLSQEFALLKTGPAEETSFLRSVRISTVRNFTGDL